MRETYGQAIIDALRTGESDAVPRAIDFLRANLTAAAIHGCHHCGEAERADAPCRWCGLRDRPRRIKATVRR